MVMGVGQDGRRRAEAAAFVALVAPGGTLATRLAEMQADYLRTMRNQAAYFGYDYDEMQARKAETERKRRRPEAEAMAAYIDGLMSRRAAAAAAAAGGAPMPVD